MKWRLECPPMFNTKKPISLDEETLLLDGRRLPARLTSAEVAVVLGFQEHDIAQLVVSKLLTTLGKPVHNSLKHFAAVDIIQAAQDREWLSTATRQISRYWQSRNERKRVTTSLAEPPQEGL
jgi:hypothetical protein